ncbi:hypothetical protein O7599_17820 [Streptomyces sp. WMMC500]|uniref:hypothetical protein n=1 Tax=Streptomyces sp. WMMC500 TaxID=3015154 RepID=UPI00248C5178|nr:hypothetical protein [Streptomyces sp. WMMC500]WBB64250.1 hypothetical protein O7599_17820 [Streptomyces sp. WMMC500]
MTDKQQPESTDGAPLPEPLRFFGTTWVDRSGGYWARRVGIAVLALALAAGGAFVLALSYNGLRLADSGGLIQLLMLVAFAVCSSLAFTRTLNGFSRAHEAGPADSSFRPIRVIGFVGVLLAYTVRSFVEAPGEGMLRRDYEDRLERHARRRSSRTGNPAKRKRKKRR